jgi:CRP/FNR family transcriptional regulator, nitrogen oxide reductase regulator
VGGPKNSFNAFGRPPAEKVEQRIARALLRLAAAQRASSSGKAEMEIALAVSRQEVAEFAGATLYTVSRTVSAWSRQGIVAGGRGRITIRKLEQLAAIAGMATA